MSEGKKSKQSRRPRGAAALWVAVALLSLVYLAVWSAEQGTTDLPQQAAGPVAPQASVPEASKQVLREAAKQAGVARAPGAQIEVESVTEANFEPGFDLRKAPAGSGERGLVIVLGVVRDGRLTERLTYHALPPNQVVFVSQEVAPKAQ